jgi:hypothetical protein
LTCQKKSQKLSRGKLSRAKLSRGKLSRGKLSRGKLSRGKLSRGKLFRGKLSRGKLSRGKLSRGKLSRGKTGIEHTVFPALVMLDVLATATPDLHAGRARCWTPCGSQKPAHSNSHFGQ